MRAFVRKVIVFSASAVVLYVVFSFVIFPPVLEKVYGPNIRKQLEVSFQNAAQRNYELLILGNSRLYCGVNPDQFDIPAYNFSHNNDSYNQLYHKLKWLLNQQKKIRVLILGVDHFQFSIFTDSRNYAYGPLLGDEYMRDYKPYHYLITHIRETLHPYKLRALLDEPVYRHGLKPNGQFIRTGMPEEDEFIKRNFNRLDIQMKYFEKILEECRTHRIKVYLCLAPMREAEISQYTPSQIQDFERFVAQYTSADVQYLDYSRDPRFTMSDFIDFTHLSQDAADKFSQLLNERILRDRQPAREIVLRK